MEEEQAEGGYQLAWGGGRGGGKGRWKWGVGRRGFVIGVQSVRMALFFAGVGGGWGTRYFVSSFKIVSTGTRKERQCESCGGQTMVVLGARASVFVSVTSAQAGALFSGSPRWSSRQAIILLYRQENQLLYLPQASGNKKQPSAFPCLCLFPNLTLPSSRSL